VALLLLTALPGAVHAETYLRSEDVLRASAYDVPTGIQLAAASAAYAAAMQAGAGDDTLRTPESYVQKHRALRTTGEIVLMNAVMTLFGKYFMDEHGFAVSWDTITNNLENGFEWDDNSFSANNFRHPYQGAQYFGAARGNGYDFWQSSMWSFLGAWLFEYMGEAHHPSYNDWINTAIGGIGLGEPLFRMQNMVLDNKATGSSRAWRELGGFLVLPLRGFNRLVTGEAFAVHQNPPDKKPDYFGAHFDLGLRTLSDEYIWKEGVTKAFLDFRWLYGDPFKTVKRPYDAFSFRLQLTFDNKPHGISRFQSRGVLASADVYKSDESQHVLSADQLYDYIDNEAYVYGGQTVAASYFSRFWKNDSFEARTRISAGAIILGACRSDYFNISGREYDYGPGAGYTVGVGFRKKGRNVMRFTHAGFWVHSINGTVADHYNRITEIRLDLPIKDFFGFGADYVLYEAERYYRDFPDTKSRNPELKLFVAWHMD